jgi:hypothetical protein
MSAAIIYKTVYLPRNEQFVVYFPKRASGKQLAEYVARSLEDNRVVVVDKDQVYPLNNMDNNQWAGLHTILVAMPPPFTLAAAKRFAPLTESAKAPHAHVITLEERDLSRRQYKKWREQHRATFPYQHLESDDVVSGVSTKSLASSGNHRVHFGNNNTLRFSKRASALTMVGKSRGGRAQHRAALKQQFGVVETAGTAAAKHAVAVYHTTTPPGLLLLQFPNEAVFTSVLRSNLWDPPLTPTEPMLLSRVLLYPESVNTHLFVHPHEVKLGLSLHSLQALHAYFQALYTANLQFTGQDFKLFEWKEHGTVVRTLLPCDVKELMAFKTENHAVYAMFNVAWHVPAPVQDSINRYVLRTFGKHTTHSSNLQTARLASQKPLL